MEQQHNNPLPIWAIYSRTGFKKILFLLKPRSREVVYTPFGLEVLSLQRTSLPPYEMAAHLIARYEEKYVILPYHQGRSSSEVEDLITEYSPLNYNIRDIPLDTIYTGLYGKIEPVGLALSKILPHQRSIVLISLKVHVSLLFIILL